MICPCCGENIEPLRRARHRLAVGDCTDPDVVASVLRGETAAAVVTDPPFALYGSSTGVSGDAADTSMIELFFRLSFQIWRKVCRAFGHVYVWCDFRTYPLIHRLLGAQGFQVKNCIVWDNGGGGPGAFYQMQHEFIAFAVNEPRQGVISRKTGHYLIHGMGNIWRRARLGTRETEHRAEKPVDLCEIAIGNSTDEGDIVLDPFLGSGTTMVAAHKLNRRCFGIEISPPYCAVVLERMSEMGLEARLLE